MGNHKTGIEPKKPFKGVLTKGGFKRYYYLNRYPAAVWAEISRQRKESLESTIRFRGLSKQSWYVVARILGLDPDAPDYVRSMRVEHPENFHAQRVNNGGDYRLRFSNAQPTVNNPRTRAAGANRLRRAIAGRVKFFEKNLKLGVFNSLAGVARAYPGLKINAAAA